MKNSRLSLTFALVSFFSFGNYANASFPVETTNSEVVEERVVETVMDGERATINDVVLQSDESKAANKNNLSSPAATDGIDDMWIALALWLVLGALAGHRWYAGKPVVFNILFILTAMGLGVWWLIDGIMILTGSFTE